MKQTIKLIGTGGHARATISAINSTGQYIVEGLYELEREPNLNEKIMGVPVVGGWGDVEIKDTLSDDLYFIAIGDNIKRAQIARHLIDKKALCPAIIAPSAIVDPTAEIEDGSLILHHAIVNAESKIGLGTIVNNGVIVDHECSVGKFVHLAPGVVLCGRVTIGEKAFIGAGTTVKQNTYVARLATVGLGSVVVHDLIEEEQIYFGTPAKLKQDFPRGET